MRIILITVLFLSNSYFIFGQTINSKDIIVSTFLPDNLLNRYNVGVEYFLNQSKDSLKNSKISVGLNGGIVSTTLKNQNINGFNLIFETNWYTDLTLPKKWNEYGGVKVSYGNFKNETLKEKKSNYFIGITTGIQPIILKRIALKVNSDIGYIKNGLTNINGSVFNSSNEIFYSGFAMTFNVGVGFRF